MNRQHIGNDRNEERKGIARRKRIERILSKLLPDLQ